MKPVHIVLLVVASAVGGALVYRVAQPAAPKPVAQATAPAAPAEPAPPPQPAELPSAAPVTAPAVPAEPPRAVEREAPRPKRVARPESRQPVAPAPTPQATGPVVESPRETATAPPPTPEPAPRTEPVNPTPPPPPPPPEPARVTLNAGTLIPVRLVDALSSERNAPGDGFTATLDRPLVVDGFVVAERGARVDGRVVSSDRGGKVKGVAALAVELTRIRTADGQTINVRTDSFERHAEQSTKDDAVKVGAGAAIGAAIGAIAGGGKGAAIGAGAGGAAGAGGVLLTRGKPVTLPSETRIDFRLNSPVTVVERR